MNYYVDGKIITVIGKIDVDVLILLKSLNYEIKFIWNAGKDHIC